MVKIKPVRVDKTQYGTYSLYFYNPDGRRRRLSVGSDYHQAQRLAIRFTDWLLEGKDPECELERAVQSEKAKSTTLGEFFPVFLRRHGPQVRQRTRERFTDFINNISRCPELINCPIGAITKRAVIDYTQARIDKEGISPSTANREAAFLRDVLSRAVEWDILSNNPLKSFRMRKEPVKREVNLTADQAAELLDELPTSVANIVEFAIYTGFRKENILSLKIEDVRFHDLQPTGEVELVVKGGRRETFQLSQQAIKVIRRASGIRSSGYIFINPRTGNRYSGIHQSFDSAVVRLNLKVNGTKLRFHDLRHVFATWLHQSGVSLDVLRTLLGHKARITTDRYAHLDRRVVGDVLSAMPVINTGKKKPRLNS